MGCCGKDDDWGAVSLRDCKQQASFGVVLRDRLMTDAALGGPNKPIKSEHSYSLLPCSPSPPPTCASPGDTETTSAAVVVQRLHQQHHQSHQRQVVCTDGTGGVFAGTIVCTSEPSRIDGKRAKSYCILWMNGEWFCWV